MKKMSYIIIAILIIACVVFYHEYQNNNNLAIYNTNIINNSKSSVYVKDSDYMERSIEFVFFSSSIIHSIDTFMIVVNDGYIYKGVYDCNIIINNLHMKLQNSVWENYTTIGFLGFDNETSSTYWWQEKQNYNLCEIKKVYVFLFSNGMMCFTIN